MKSNLPYYMWKVSHVFLQYRIPFLPFLVKQMLRFIFGAIIPPQARIGKGTHFGFNGMGVVIHPRCQIGEKVLISHQVTLGGRGGAGVPLIGNSVYIGAGAKILGGVTIGDGAKIGANAVVITDVPAGSIAVGIPGRIIENDDERFPKAWLEAWN